MGFSRQEYWSGLHSLFQWTMFCRTLHYDRSAWVVLHIMAHSFIELEKAVVHVIRLVSFLERKSRKSRNTQSNRQLWPSSTEWSRATANSVLPRERTGHSKHPLPKTQEKTLCMDITRWSIPKSDWSYSLQPKMEKLYTVSKKKTRNRLWLRSWTPYCQIQT